MCYYPITLKNPKRKPTNNKYLNTVPCGKCVKCIQKKRSEWAFRLHQESQDHAHAYFITTTYNEHELPYLNISTGEFPVRLKDGLDKYKEEDYLEKIVYKKDVQDFIKNIRRQVKYHIPKHKTRLENVNTKIRYYFTSEYGTKSTKRPHYHGIVWNLHPNIARKIENQKIWTKGNVQIKPIDNNISTYYYLTKYLYKQKNYNIWTFKPFTLMSTKPFIGNRYLETSTQYHKAKQDLLTKFNNRQIIIPRIYRDKLPNYLKEKTREKITEYTIKEEKNDFHKYKTIKNHHPDILKYFKQQTKEKREKLEQLTFNQKFRNYVNI